MKKLKANKLNVVSNNFSKLYNEGIIVVSQPPTRRVVNLDLYSGDNYDLQGTFEGNFFLSFPTIYFRLHYRKILDGRFCCCGLTVVAIGEDKNKVFAVPLPNVFLGGMVCIKLYGKYESLPELCKDVIQNFWSSEFNGDVASNMALYRRCLLGNYNKWQAKTKKMPNWVPSDRNLRIDRTFSKSFFYGDSYKKKGGSESSGDDPYEIVRNDHIYDEDG